MAKLSNETKKRLREIAEKQASKIAKEFEKEMCTKYESLIEMYYREPYKTNPPHYTRTGNLRNSYNPYFQLRGNAVVGGIEISGDRMDDYDTDPRHPFTGERFLEKYFFSPTYPSATWHGGDWHGGYGVMANFSAYEEMVKHYQKTVKDFRKRYGL